MMKLEIDYTFRNREEVEEWLNPCKWYVPRLHRIAWLLFAIATIPLEMGCELLLIFIGFVARVGGAFLWATNPEIPIKQTNAEEES